MSEDLGLRFYYTLLRFPSDSVYDVSESLKGLSKSRPANSLEHAWVGCTARRVLKILLGCSSRCVWTE